MISNQPKDTNGTFLLLQSSHFQGPFPEWVFIPIPFGDTKPTFVAQVCMDNHLILLLHEDLLNSLYGSFNSLVAFDLRDHSVQKIKLDHTVSNRGKLQTFIRYKDNQIIKFGGYTMGSVGYSPLERFTIESFQRTIPFYQENSLILKLFLLKLKESMLMGNCPVQIVTQYKSTTILCMF